MSGQPGNLNADTGAGSALPSFTPGPWHAKGRTIFPVTESGLSIAVATQHRAETMANARLIAAAPDLYRIAAFIVRHATTEELSTHVEVSMESHELALLLAAAEAAIAKAEGRA